SFFAFLFFSSFPTRRSSDLVFLIHFFLAEFHSKSNSNLSSFSFSRYYAIIFPLSNQNKWLTTKSQYMLVLGWLLAMVWAAVPNTDRKSTRLNSSHVSISYAV